MSKLKKLPHYWICSDCADRMGAKFPEGHICTSCMGDCGYCGTKDTRCTPVVDFDWPKEVEGSENFKYQRD